MLGKLFKKQKLSLFLGLALSLFAVFVFSISTLAWFQIDQTPISTNIVSSTPDIEIDNSNVNGYKINPTYNEFGLIDYSNTSVTKKGAESTTIDSVDNTNQADADLDFDVPENGIGYYLVVASAEGSFKFHSCASYQKLSEYSTGNLCFSTDIYLSASKTLRIRSYQMSGTQTALSDITVSSVTYQGAINAGCLSNGDIVIPTIGTYKVWYDKSTKAVGLEFRSASDLTSRGKIMRKELHGTDTIYMSIVDFTGWASGARFACIYSTTNSGGTWANMTKVAENFYSISIDTSTYLYIDFCRMNGSTATNNWDNKWNDTGYKQIPTDIYGGNNCFYVKGWDNTGDWGTYSSRSYAVTMSYNSGSYKAMTLEGGTSYYYDVASAATNASLAFKINGEAISVSKNGGSSGFNDNNLTDAIKIKYGNSRPIRVYLDISNQQVWVSTVYEFCVAGSTKYLASQVKSGDGDYDSNYRQYKATYSGTAGQAVTVLVNGVSKSYTRDGDTYNNINTSKNLVKTVTDKSAYLKFSGGDSSPTWSSGTVWLDGNKVYTLSVNGGSTYPYEMSYYNGVGTFNGWYYYSGVSVTSGNTVAVKINGTAQSISYYSTDASNSINSSKEFKATGQVDVFFDTSTNKIFATPIYLITIGSTTKQAFDNDLDGTFETSSSSKFSMVSGQSITATYNGSSLTLTRKSDVSLSDRNNITTAGLQVMYDAIETAELTISNSTNYIWLNGYAPSYYYSTNDGSTWTQMTYNANVSTSEVTASIPSGLAAGTSIRFRKSGSNTGYNASVSANTNTFNNLSGNPGSLVTVTRLTSSTTLKLNFDNNTAYLGGRTLTYYFYNGDPNIPENTVFRYHLWNSSTQASLASYPGSNMTVDPNDSRLFSFSFNVDTGYDSVIFNYGTGTSTTEKAYQTVDINLTSVSIGYYARVSAADNGYSGAVLDGDGGKLKWSVEWFSNPPVNDEDNVYYAQDSGNANFGGNVFGYAWDSVNGHMDSHGALFPGIPTEIIISGSLYKYTVADEYNGFKFSNSSASKQTSDFTRSNCPSGSVWIATSNAGSTVSGDWATLKTTSVGTATIYKSNDGSNWDSGTAMFDGDLSTNDYMYELGLSAQHGTFLKVVVNPTAGSTTTYSNNSNFISDDYTRPYLEVNASHIKVTLENNSATARFNFYVTHSGRLAIVMVPDYGNGFYIMDQTNSNNTTEGFIGGYKMNTSSATSAVFSGFHATANQKIFIRSYMNAVDTLYTVLASGHADTVSIDAYGVITFSSEGYYDISVAGGKIQITKYSVSEFFKLNPLDTTATKINSSLAIYNQKTTLVLEVPFTCKNDYPSKISVYVNNSLSDYVGVTLCCYNSQLLTPHETIRGSSSPSSFYTALSNTNTISDQNNLTVSDSSHTYYAYIMIDYLPTSVEGVDYSDFVTSVNLATTLTFYLQSTQA